MIFSTRRLFTLVLFLAFFALCTRNVTDPDFGWHLRTGQDIVTSGSVPQADAYSFTAAGQPRTTHEWLVDVLIYLLHRIGGFSALVLFFAVLATFAFAILYSRCRGKPFVAGFVVLLAALAAAPFWGVRPQTISILYASGLLYLLDHHRQGRAGRSIFWLVPMTLLWANSHGSYALGPAFIAIYLLGGEFERRFNWNSDTVPRSSDTARLAAVFVLSLAVIAINPAGLQLYVYPFETLNSGVIQTLIQEWQAPDFHLLALQPFAAMLVLLILALTFSRRKVGLVEGLLLLVFTYASLRSVRQISIWVLIAAPVLSSGAFDWLSALAPQAKVSVVRKPTRLAQAMNNLMVLVCTVAVLLRAAGILVDQGQAERDYFPVAAVNRIQAENLEGPILNQYEWGGYLIWQLYPRERVFIDGRSDLYGLTGDTIVKEYLKAYNASSDWREPLERYNIRLVLLEPDAPLAVRLAEDGQWKRVYADSQAVVFVLNDGSRNP